MKYENQQTNNIIHSLKTFPQETESICSKDLSSRRQELNISVATKLLHPGARLKGNDRDL